MIARPFAHRGLHGGGRIENSRAAFEAAIAQGQGIELDVQASRDGHAVVFHDYDLERLTTASGKVAHRTLAELRQVRLRGTVETIPDLPEILALIGGRASLLIEVKAPRRVVSPLCRSVRRALEGYTGPVAVMSFNPEVGYWFSVHAPHVLRGLVATEREKRGAKGDLQRRLALWRSRPHFLAYDIRDLPSRFAAGARRPVLTWTVRTADDRARAGRHADQIIHELPVLS
ncbi:MAG TPA: glycerophosphodiester phosphodiesterase family protein [Allosphingosinicella sp.]